MRNLILEPFDHNHNAKTWCGVHHYSVKTQQSPAGVSGRRGKERLAMRVANKPDKEMILTDQQRTERARQIAATVELHVTADGKRRWVRG